MYRQKFLLDHSKLVATVTGTAAWEAICQKKKAIVFGYVWHRFLPGIFRFDEIKNFDDVLTGKVNWDSLESEFNKLMSRSCRGSLDSSIELEGKDSPSKNLDNLYMIIKEAIQRLMNSNV